MKKIYFLLCILQSGFTFAQSSLNGTWYLQKMNVNGVEYFPQTTESIAEISYDTNWGDVMTKICLQQAYNLSNTNPSSYTINQYSGISGTCTNATVTNFQTIYFGAFQKTVNYLHNYVITGSGISRVLTVTTSAGDIFVYGVEKVLSRNEVEKEKFDIFPNPVKDYINIKNFSEIELIAIYDMAGNLILKQKNVNDKINVNNLQNGTYMVEVLGKNGQKQNIKIIKN